MITVASVVTNAGLAVFTMQNLDSYAATTRYWCFIGFQWMCFSLQVSMFSYAVCTRFATGNLCRKYVYSFLQTMCH